MDLPEYNKQGELLHQQYHARIETEVYAEGKDIHIPGSSIYQMQRLSKEPSISCEMHTCMLNKRQGYHFFRIAGKLLLSAHIQ